MQRIQCVYTSFSSLFLNASMRAIFGSWRFPTACSLLATGSFTSPRTRIVEGSSEATATDVRAEAGSQHPKDSKTSLPLPREDWHTLSLESVTSLCWSPGKVAQQPSLNVRKLPCTFRSMDL